MKIVFVGGGSGMAGALLDHLYREGNDLFWISPVKPSQAVSFDLKCTHFPFRANDAGIQYVLESIDADALIYLGAYDDSLRYGEGENGGEQLMSDLSSLLALTERNQIDRFLFLSSQEVYGEGVARDLTEEDEPFPATIKGEFLASAERMLLVFGGSEARRILIARLGNAYGPQVTMPGAPGYVLSMCLSAEKEHQIEASESAVRRPVYLADAAQGLWQLLSAPDAPSGIYHFAGNETITDSAVAQRVAEFIPGTSVTDSGEEAQLCLSNEKTAKMLGYRPTHSLADSLAQTIQWAHRYLQHNEPPAVTQAPEETAAEAPRSMARSLWRVVRPYLESLLLLALSTAASYIFRNHPQFGAIDYLLIYVIVIAALYGKLHAAVATVLATVANLYIQADGGSILSVMLQYGQFLRTGIMFTLGMLVGHVRDQFALEKQAHEDEMEHQQQQYNELMVINEANASIKSALEQRLLGYGDSFAKIISIISELDMMEPQRVTQAAVDVVRRLMRTEDVSIYQVADGGVYARLAAASSPAARVMGKSVRLTDYPLMNEAFEASEVYVNRTLTEGYPLMAAPVMVGPRMVYIIMLWSMDFERLSPYSVNLLTVMGRLISSSADRAYRYSQAMRGERYLPGTEILNASAFEEALSTQRQGFERGIQEYAVLRIPADFVRQNDLPDLSVRLVAILRDADIIGQDRAGNILLLLSNTSEEDALFVIRRLGNAGIPAEGITV